MVDYVKFLKVFQDQLEVKSNFKTGKLDVSKSKYNNLNIGEDAILEFFLGPSNRLFNWLKYEFIR